MALDVEHLQRETLRIIWTDAVDQLMIDATDWSVVKGWRVETQDVVLTENANETYQVPFLTVVTNQGSVVLEPLSRLVFGAQGRVDLYDQIARLRVMLLLEPNGIWVVRTDSGINWPNPWGRETFYQLVDALLNPE